MVFPAMKPGKCQRINRIIMEFKFGNKSSNVEYGILELIES